MVRCHEVILVSQRSDQVAEHVGAGREAVQQQQCWIARIAGLAIEHFESLDCGGLVPGCKGAHGRPLFRKLPSRYWRGRAGVVESAPPTFGADHATGARRIRDEPQWLADASALNTRSPRPRGR